VIVRMNSSADGSLIGLGDHASYDGSGAIDGSRASGLPPSRGSSAGGGNRFFQMLVGSGLGGSYGETTKVGDHKGASLQAGGSTALRASFDLNDFPSLAPDSAGFPNGGGIGTSSTSASSATDFAAALSRAATGQAIASNNNLHDDMNLHGTDQIETITSGLVGSSLSSAAAGAMSGSGMGSAAGMNGWSSGTSHHSKFSMAKEDFPALPVTSAHVQEHRGSSYSALVGSTKFNNLTSPLFNHSSSVVSGTNGSSPGEIGCIRTNESANSSIPGTASIHRSPSQQPNSQPQNSLGGVIYSTSPSLHFAAPVHQQKHVQLKPSQVLSSFSSSRASVVPIGNNGPTANMVGGASKILGGEYGLLGLLSVIRLSDADRSSLAFGSDLTLLGLNLNSPEPLYKTFAGPFVDSDHIPRKQNLEPAYHIPSCYYVPSTPALKTGHLAKFQLETLFYVFYSFTRDVLQAHAAQELYNRDWKYHGELRLWFKYTTAGSSNDHTAFDVSDGKDEKSTSINGQKQLIFFDTSTWERRLYTSSVFQRQQGSMSDVRGGMDIPPSGIVNGLLNEHEVQIKMSPA